VLHMCLRPPAKQARGPETMAFVANPSSQLSN
jgi:hypothetical protein